ncbi:LRR receptor-like serine/threonine-protein kinase GSO1 [Rhododendron vialii]|uniref:LRR receptor-like serine/threonine-protein kinase GSO1 n=1 Tax=Rhododendron vialii TaxID=182163 RepID=UPI00265F664C|nr:LRR receptor-like serine/threonine-protein kinase GSO1 [Rhododendron vialii]
MASSSSISAISLLFFTLLSLSCPLLTLSASVIEDLNNLHPPPDFNTTVSNNCKTNPSLRYCINFTPLSLPEIFKFTIVASHLCSESKNPNCIDSFPKINLQNRPKIAPLYLSFDFFWKYCPLTVSSIDLSNNSLKGNFPSDIFYCSQIQSLDLSQNHFSGEIPIQNFSVFTNLTFLNLSYNSFLESEISDSDQLFKRFNSSSFMQSGIIPDKEKSKIKALLFLIVFPIFVLLLVIFHWWICFSRPDFLPKLLRRKHKFTPSMLKAATNGFSKKNLVAKSEGIRIYKGVLRDGTEIRIETYLDNNKISREKRRDFVVECKVLVKLCHKNLVQVLGWCDNRRLRAIVTEWIEGESVKMWVSRVDPPWKHRVKVLMRVVEGMRYLQEEWPEVGYELKSSNILLGEEREPLISRFRVEDQSSCSKKVYKFGVLLLEMVTNRSPRQGFERGEAGFVEWVRMHYPDNLIDEKRKAGTLDQATQVIELGLMCTDLSRGMQPSLDQMLDNLTAIYNSILASASPYRKRVHGDRATGPLHVQSG